MLENVSGQDDVIAEISRQLAPHWLFVFTVPVAQFERDLERYFGRAESRQVNADYYHRNLMEVSDWRALLAKHDLSIVQVQEYQPAWFSYYYMMFRFLGNRALGRFFPNIRQSVWNKHSAKLADMVRRSIDGTVRQGGNICVVAEKSAR